VIGRSEGMECAARFSRRSLATVRAIRTSARETKVIRNVISVLFKDLFFHKTNKQIISKVGTHFGSHGYTIYPLRVSRSLANRTKTAVDGSWLGRLSRNNLRAL
jgi:hypothetical protein